MRLVIEERVLEDNYSSKYRWGLWEGHTMVASGFASWKWTARWQARRLKRKIERQRAKGRIHEEYKL